MDNNYHDLSTIHKRRSRGDAIREKSKKSARRMSVLDKFTQTQEFIRTNFERLTELWDEIALTEDARCRRTQVAFEHIYGLVENMVASEEDMVAEVKRDIVSGMKTIDKLRDELEMLPWHSDLPMNSIALLRAVEKERDFLQGEHDERKTEQNNLINKLLAVAEKTGTDVEQFVPYTKKVCTMRELEALRAKLATLEDDLSQRREQVVAGQKKIKKWMAKIGHLYDNDDTDLNFLINGDVDSDTFLLHDNILETLNGYSLEISAVYEEWYQELDMKWRENFQNLEELYEKCSVPQHLRSFSGEFDPDYNTESDIDNMIKECATLSMLYQSRQAIYDMVNSFKTYWNELMVLTAKTKEEGYLQSRKNNVLRDQRETKELNAKLDALEAKITKNYEDYLEKHPGDSFRVDGFEPTQWIRNLKDEERICQQDVHLRKIAKRHATPSKTPRIGPPAKRNPDFSLFKTPGKTPSIIQPTSQDARIGPKTSSPKCSTPKSSRNLPMFSSPKPRSPIVKTPMKKTTSKPSMSPLCRRN